MNVIMTALAKGAVALLWNKKTLKWLIRNANEKLAERVKLNGKEYYAEIFADAMAELNLRATCVSDDGIVNADENEKIIAFDEALVDKYWKED